MPLRKRPHFHGVWLSTPEQAEINNRAEKDEKHSTLLRRMLAYAARHMPKGWKP